MAHFRTRTTVERGQVVVALIGECDLSTRDELTSTLLAAVNSAEVVVVDLEALNFLDSSGINALVTAHNAASGAGRRLCLTNAKGLVADVLEMTGIGELLKFPGEASEPVHR